MNNQCLQQFCHDNTQILLDLQSQTLLSQPAKPDQDTVLQTKPITDAKIPTAKITKTRNPQQKYQKIHQFIDHTYKSKQNKQTNLRK